MDLTLKEIVDENPIEFLGENHVEKFGNQTGVLVKLIDSAERLIIQTHPDKEKRKNYFILLMGKPNAGIFLEVGKSMVNPHMCTIALNLV